MAHKFNPHTDELDYYKTNEEHQMFPIGAIYLTINNINPGQPRAAGGLGYGTWVQVAQGDMLVGAP